MGIRRATVSTLAALIGLVVGAVIAAWSPAGTASACSCAAYTDEEAFAAADVVFTGTLLRTVTPDAEAVWSSDDPEWFVFEVDTVFAGDALEVQVVETARDGASCGLELGGVGPFLVFATAVDEVVSSNLCSGSRPLAQGAIPTSFGEGRPPTPGTSPEPPDSGAVDDTTASIALLAAAASVIVVAVGWRARRRAAGQVIDAA